MIVDKLIFFRDFLNNYGVKYVLRVVEWVSRDRCKYRNRFNSIGFIWKLESFIKFYKELIF